MSTACLRCSSFLFPKQRGERYPRLRDFTISRIIPCSKMRMRESTPSKVKVSEEEQNGSRLTGTCVGLTGVYI